MKNTDKEVRDVIENLEPIKELGKEEKKRNILCKLINSQIQGYVNVLKIDIVKLIESVYELEDNS
jgi:hypothetical protein